MTTSPDVIAVVVASLPATILKMKLSVSFQLLPVSSFVTENVCVASLALYVFVNILSTLLSFFSVFTLNTGSDAINVPVPLSVTVIVYVSSLSEYVIPPICPDSSVTLKL